MERDALMTNPADSTPASSSTQDSNTLKHSQQSFSTINRQHFSSPQDSTNKNSATINNTSTSSSALATAQRRTTSLLNIFSSNSQGMLILQL